jgi:DNA polymerase I
MNSYEQISSQFYGNRLLFGDPSEDSIVALEIASPTEVEIFRRRHGELSRERRPLRLFLLLADRELMKQTRIPHETIEMTGDFRFRYLVSFGSTAGLETAKRHLRSVSGKTASAADAPYFVLSDPVEQHLMLTGSTFFIGLGFQDLRRMQLDIETYTSSGFEFASAGREGDRITAIAITDSTGYERVLDGHATDERAMLEDLVQIVNERDPDVIEGHNLFRSDLEYLEQRARRHKLKLALGRDGSVMRARASRLQIAERTIAYRRYEIYGRSVIDTWILAQFYDISSRELEGFGLRELAEHFRIAGSDRVYLDPARMSHYFDREPELLMRSALEDARRAARAQLLHPGTDFPLLVPERGAARQCDAHRCPADTELPCRAPFDSRARRALRGRRRIHRDAPLRRRAWRAALRCNVALSFADASVRACAAERSARRLPQDAR